MAPRAPGGRPSEPRTASRCRRFAGTLGWRWTAAGGSASDHNNFYVTNKTGILSQAPDCPTND